eukprot:177656_1
MPPGFNANTNDQSYPPNRYRPNDTNNSELNRNWRNRFNPDLNATASDMSPSFRARGRNIFSHILHSFTRWVRTCESKCCRTNANHFKLSEIDILVQNHVYLQNHQNHNQQNHQNYQNHQNHWKIHIHKSLWMYQTQTAQSPTFASSSLHQILVHSNTMM